MKTNSFIHSLFNKYFLSTKYVPDLTQGVGDTVLERGLEGKQSSDSREKWSNLKVSGKSPSPLEVLSSRCLKLNQTPDLPPTPTKKPQISGSHPVFSSWGNDSLSTQWSNQEHYHSLSLSSLISDPPLTLLAQLFLLLSIWRLHLLLSTSTVTWTGPPRPSRGLRKWPPSRPPSSPACCQ